MAESRALPLHEDPGIQSHRHSHPLVWCRVLGSLLEADQATSAVSSVLLAIHPWHQMARPCVKRRSPLESQPAQHTVHLAPGAAAPGWPCVKDGRHICAQSSLLQRSPKKESATMVPQENVMKTSWRDSFQRWESMIGHDSRKPLTKTAGAYPWEKPVVSSR